MEYVVARRFSLVGRHQGIVIIITAFLIPTFPWKPEAQCTDTELKYTQSLVAPSLVCVFDFSLAFRA